MQSLARWKPLFQDFGCKQTRSYRKTPLGGSWVQGLRLQGFWGKRKPFESPNFSSLESLSGLRRVERSSKPSESQRCPISGAPNKQSPSKSPFLRAFFCCASPSCLGHESSRTLRSAAKRPTSAPGLDTLLGFGYFLDYRESGLCFFEVENGLHRSVAGSLCVYLHVAGCERSRAPPKLPRFVS